ncbi:relaxin receptor 2-like [Culicoides brevitarsis]|uniref:relaxin receptor 2-like n=1 Tax=Culicoides brevitarsis TaxID=469753 RepID=UPI00307B1DE0
MPFGIASMHTNDCGRKALLHLGNNKIDVVGGKSAASNFVYNVANLFYSPETQSRQSIVDECATCGIGCFSCNVTDAAGNVDDSSSPQCIPQRKNCDNIVDCENGSDEQNCDDHVGNEYWNHLFRKNPGAEIDTKECSLRGFSVENKTCTCLADNIICTHKGFTQIPHFQPMSSSIDLLDLSGNFYPVLTKQFFETLPSVRELVLKHCEIETIEPFAFDRLRFVPLHVLHLSQNKIQTLPNRMFPHETNLQNLILSGNEISEMQDLCFVNLEHLIELDLRNNSITTFNKQVFESLKHLKILYLNENYITAVPDNLLPRLDNLISLSLDKNQITKIGQNAFNFPRLQHLFLSENRIRVVEEGTFARLPNLLGLSLNDNNINVFRRNAFRGLHNLTTLHLQNNEFKSLSSKTLQNLTSLQHIYFSHFSLCRAAMHVRVCLPRGDGISSTRHLLDNIVLRTSVWIMASIGIFGNLLVLSGQFFGGTRTHAEHLTYLRHLAASDLIMGIYLATIATADITFRNVYLEHDEAWRHSMACGICGFLSTLSCQSSTLLLTLVTWDRLISVIRPLKPRPPSKTRAVARLTILWTISSTTAILPLTGIPYFGDYFYGNNGVCLSLHIHDPYARGWEYSAAIFILVNTLSLLFIVISYLRMLKAIKTTGEAMRSTLSGRENIVARRFAVIVATDCICWLPVIVVKLAALGGVQISPYIYAWLAVLVLPINSSLNPIIYTLTTAQFKQQIRRFCYRRGYGVTIESQSNNGFESTLGTSLKHMPSNGSQRRLLQRQKSGLYPSRKHLILTLV